MANQQKNVNTCSKLEKETKRKETSDAIFCSVDIIFIVVLEYISVIWDPAGIYRLKINNSNTRASCEICSKSTIKVPGQLRRFGVFIANFEQIFHVVLVFLLLPLLHVIACLVCFLPRNTKLITKFKQVHYTTFNTSAYRSNFCL